MDKFDSILKMAGADPKKKAIIITVVVLVIVLFAVIIYKIVKKEVKEVVNYIPDKLADEEYVNAVDRRTGNTEGGTYTDREFEQMADRLYEAMNGWTTDEDAVKAVMEMVKSDSDWARLVKAFGKRDSSINPFDSAAGLDAWIVDDFSDRDDIEYFINAPLRKNGVNKQF